MAAMVPLGTALLDEQPARASRSGVTFALIGVVRRPTLARWSQQGFCPQCKEPHTGEALYLT